MDYAIRPICIDYAMQPICCMDYAVRPICGMYYAVQPICGMDYAIQPICCKDYAMRLICCMGYTPGQLGSWNMDCDSSAAALHANGVVMYIRHCCLGLARRFQLL